MCSWETAGERATTGDKDDTANRAWAVTLSQARGMRSARVNKLYCTDVYCEWVSCLHPERTCGGADSNRTREHALVSLVRQAADGSRPVSRLMGNSRAVTVDEKVNPPSHAAAVPTWCVSSRIPPVCL